MLYACDGGWWDATPDTSKFKGLKFTQDKNAAARHNIIYIPAIVTDLDAGRGVGFCLDAPIIHTGANSGYQLINLTGHFCAWSGKIVVLGLDCGAPGGVSHWHGDHLGGLNNPNIHTFEAWLRNFERVPETIKDTDVEVLNASRWSALEVFPRIELESIIKHG